MTKTRTPTENSKKHLKEAKEVESLNPRWNTVNTENDIGPHFI